MQLESVEIKTSCSWYLSLALITFAYIKDFFVSFLKQQKKILECLKEDKTHFSGSCSVFTVSPFVTVMRDS